MSKMIAYDQEALEAIKRGVGTLSRVVTKTLGSRGPAPPPGSGQHRNFFKLYALDAELDLKAGVSKKQLVQAMSGHILTEAQLKGTYQR